jgi:membrane protein implicated in regulation of membrane protease activity
MIIELLNNLEPWHWLSLGLLLLGAEALGASGFLLGTAIAAFLLAIINALFSDISWQTQLILFAIAALGFSIAYWKYFKEFNNRSDHGPLNQRAASLIGRELVVEHDLTGGQGRIQIGDTFWKVKFEGQIDKGTRIKVVDADSMSLQITSIS